MTSNERYIRELIVLVRDALKTQNIDCRTKFIKEAIRDSVYLDRARIINYLTPHATKLSDTKWRIYERKHHYYTNRISYYLIHIGCNGRNTKCHRFQKISGYISRYGNCRHNVPEDIMTQFKLI